MKASPRARHFAILLFALAVACCPDGLSAAWADDIPDISGEYHFLAPEDTLGILEEEGRLKGYVDVAQGEDESDTVLSYQITLGTRKGDHVEFKTGKIHERYYRFTGTVERGSGHGEADPDFLRLVGDLEIIKVDSATQQEQTESRRAVFKWKGKSERDNEQ
ncbi:MAG TPA: hypothetical protein VI455_15500 [Terriglobia bacterium]